MLTAAPAPGAADPPATNPVSSFPVTETSSLELWCFHHDSWRIPRKAQSLHDGDGGGMLGGSGLWEVSLHCRPHSNCVLPQVILVVDEVLETQDLDGDGLMTPAELINFPGEAPRRAEHREPPEPQDSGRQPLLGSPSPQESQEALGPREAGGQAEALEPVQESGGKAPGPGGGAEGQAEARDTGKEAEELPGETLESKNAQNEFEGHAVQLENDEI